MTELENYHFATIIVIIDSSKNYQWIVKVANESLKRKNIFNFKILLHKSDVN